MEVLAKQRLNTCPLVWGWYALDTACWMFSSLKILSLSCREHINIFKGLKFAKMTEEKMDKISPGSQTPSPDLLLFFSLGQTCTA